jgi:serine/threonine-protein kinase
LIELAENTVVADRFRLVRMIGRGGMGSVWQAVHIGLDTPCALKFIEGELGKVAEAHERFEREAKMSAQLRSPHIVQIIDHGVWQERPYIAMELLEGTDLGKLISQHGKLPPQQLNTIIQQVCRALTKAHAAGIVHRDLKPDNIFITNDDDRVHVKILDFGVAKATGQAIENSNTKTGAMLGTPYYMSPEQAQGIKSVDARSDLWSVAVIVYQCLTGKLPFESEALGDLLVKIIVQPIPVPSQVAPVPAGFDRWWAKAADRNPDQRFQSAKELASSLEMALGLTTSMSGHSSVPGSDPMMRTALLGAPAPAYAPAQPPNMATFSGVEAGLPKKGMPPALIAVFAAALVIGLVGGGIAIAKRSPASAPSSTMAQGAPPPVVEKAAEKVPEPEIPPPPPATEPVASAAPEPSAAPVVKVAAPTHAAPAPAPKPASAPAPAGSAKKKWDPGF